MAEKNVIKKLEAEIKKIEDKKFKVFFFVVDTKGAPTGTLAYIYETAYQLKELGYNVQMLHAEKEFVGVESWLGEKYASLPHVNVDKDTPAVSPSDFLFIPEICTSIMAQTKQLPCKRIAILQNYAYLTDTIPMGIGWNDLKINECVTTSERLANKITKCFPRVKASIVRPSIPEYFFDEATEPQKLIINVVAKDKTDVNSIMKPFYWKFPMYNWVAFREVKNLPREEFAKTLREGIATIWADTFTDFGYSALEAMACKNIVIGKVPESTPEWMEDAEGNLLDNGVWYYDSSNAQDLIAGVIQSFLSNNVPEKIYEDMTNTAKAYLPEGQKSDIQEVYVKGYFEERKKELQIAINVEKENNKENNE